MINIEDKSYIPNITELCDYTGNELFTELCEYMSSEYSALQKIEYSGDKLLLGWNLKYKKCGRTLCTVYPREGHFKLLLVVGSKEKDRVEQLMPTLSDEFVKTYSNTVEGMGQRWLIFDFCEKNKAYEDVLKVVKIRKENKKCS